MRFGCDIQTFLVWLLYRPNKVWMMTVTHVIFFFKLRFLIYQHHTLVAKCCVAGTSELVGGRTEDIHFFSISLFSFFFFFPVYLYSLPRLISYNCFLLQFRYNLILRSQLFMIDIFKVVSLNVRSVILSASWTGSKGWWWLGKKHWKEWFNKWLWK